MLICVPTPLTRQREPDLAYVVGTTEAIAPHLKPRPADRAGIDHLSRHDARCDAAHPRKGRASNPASISFWPIRPSARIPATPSTTPPRFPRWWAATATTRWRWPARFTTSSLPARFRFRARETAEAVKLTENIFRAVNIALVNELKLVYEAMGIDVWEVIEAAKTKPFGYMPFYPGPGLGGHCIPIDPFYLTWKAREYGITTRFIELAGEDQHGDAASRRRQAGAGAERPVRQRPQRRARAAARPRLQEEHR